MSQIQEKKRPVTLQYEHQTFQHESISTCVMSNLNMLYAAEVIIWQLELTRLCVVMGAVNISRQTSALRIRHWRITGGDRPSDTCFATGQAAPCSQRDTRISTNKWASFRWKAYQLNVKFQLRLNWAANPETHKQRLCMLWCVSSFFVCALQELLPNSTGNEKIACRW
jgi:hypothetical protein